MPIYEYRCKSCGTTHEIEHGFNDDRPTKCPACGADQLVRVFHPVGVVFKGSGFHKTDYSGAGLKKSAPEAPTAKTEPAAKTGSSSDAAKSDAKPSASPTKGAKAKETG